MGLGASLPINRFTQPRLVAQQEHGSNGTTHQPYQTDPDKTKGNHPQVVDHNLLADKFADDTRRRLEA